MHTVMNVDVVINKIIYTNQLCWLAELLPVLHTAEELCQTCKRSDLMAGGLWLPLSSFLLLHSSSEFSRGSRHCWSPNLRSVPDTPDVHVVKMMSTGYYNFNMH